MSSGISDSQGDERSERKESVGGERRGMVGLGKQENKNKQECRSERPLYSSYMTGIFEI